MSMRNEAWFPLPLLNYLESSNMTVLSSVVFPEQGVEALTQVSLFCSASSFHETCKSIVFPRPLTLSHL